MANIVKDANISDPGDLDMEVTLQRIFREEDPTAHRAAIFELLHMTDDWNIFERISEIGGERGIAAYFQNILDQFDEPNPLDENISDLPIIPIAEQTQIRDLYNRPLLCLRQQDWAGSAASMHEILITEIYDVYQLDESILPLEEATSAAFEQYIDEEVLFPLAIIEFMAYSDHLTRALETAILNNFLSLLLTLFFSAQAHLDVVESKRNPGLEPGDTSWTD